MKKSIILGCLFLAAVSFSAQEKGTKNTAPIKDTKAEVVNPINPEVFNKEKKTTTKVVIVPTNSNSTNRSAQTTNNTNKPEKPVIVNNRAANTPKPTGLNPEKVKEVTKGKKEK